MSINLVGIVTKKFAARTIHPWCENTKIIVDSGAIYPSAVIIFLRDWRFIIFFGFGWLEYTSYAIRFHMKMLHSSTKTTVRPLEGDWMNAPKILAPLKLWRIPITCCMATCRHLFLTLLLFYCIDLISFAKKKNTKQIKNGLSIK